MIDAAVIDRYALAIFELGVESDDLGALSEQVRRLAQAYEHSDDLRAVLDNPLVDEPQREAVLREIGQRLGLGQLALNAVRVLAARRRLRALPDIARRLGTLADERDGVLRASVTSAGDLPASFLEKLKSELESATGRKLVIEHQRDPSLIAGLVTRIGDNTIDGSLKGRLGELQRRLLIAGQS